MNGCGRVTCYGKGLSAPKTKWFCHYTVTKQIVYRDKGYAWITLATTDPKRKMLEGITYFYKRWERVAKD